MIAQIIQRGMKLLKENNNYVKGCITLQNV